ncbi:SdpI family protein [Leifsonia poae]|uniref:SdpI family protein n=1 Tax=Leifsonia poae TaxID=110933 RepID=UPI001CC0995E|nr:SdpI family protein [Leifsonia poae]
MSCVAAGHGRIPLNHLVGIRLPSLLRSETAWRAGHEAAVTPAIVASALALVFSVIGLFAPLAYVGAIVVFVGGVSWVFVRASKAATAAG